MRDCPYIAAKNHANSSFKDESTSYRSGRRFEAALTQVLRHGPLKRRSAAALSFTQAVRARLFPPPDVHLPRSQMHAGLVDGCNCTGQLTRTTRLAALPTTFLDIGLSENGADWSFDELPAEMDLSESGHDGEHSGALFEIDAVFIYSGRHFAGYMCFQRPDGGQPHVVFNDCIATPSTQAPSFKHGRLLLPDGYRLLNVWYTQRSL